MLAIGLAAALVASVLLNVGIALQGIEARSAPPSLAHRASLLMLLLRRRRWLLGWLLGVVGIGPQVLALVATRERLEQHAELLVPAVVLLVAVILVAVGTVGLAEARSAAPGLSWAHE